MKVTLIHKPSTGDLSRMYYELSLLGARCVGAKTPWKYKITDSSQLLVLASQMSRYDPRLFGVLVEYFFHHWEKWNPLQLRQALLECETPQVWGVIGEFICAFNPDPEIRNLFHYLLFGIEPAERQFFFIGLYPASGHLATRAEQESLKEFSVWGFISRERPVIDEKIKRGVGTWDKNARQHILKRLLQSRGTIAISDYLNELDHTISRQQALKDLSTTPWAKPQGKGRGVRYQFDMTVS